MFARLLTPSARLVLLSPPTRVNQDEIEERFFSEIFLRNGTAKITATGRHRDLNALVLAHLPEKRPLAIMDVGVSSGVTTLEWLESLREAGVDCRMVAGDLTAHASLWTLGGLLRVLTEENGYPLQYDLGGAALSNYPSRIRRLLLLLPNLVFQRTLGRPVAAGNAAGKVAPGVFYQRVPLVSPRLTATGLEIVDDDVFEPWTSARRFDVVRAANVLNPTHFDADQLRKGLASLRGRLSVGGMLILCRTHGLADAGGNRATLLRLQQDGTLVTLARLGGGAELEALALSLGPR